MTRITKAVRYLKNPDAYEPVLKLQEFIAALKEAHPTWKTYMCSSTSAWVYRDEDELAMGLIEVASSYSVRSRLITNRRYRDSNKLHYTKSATKLQAAVKVATQYLVPPDTHEVAMYYASDFSDAVYVAHNQGRSAFQRADLILFGSVYNRGNQPVVDELAYLVSSGYQFRNPEVRKQVADYLEVLAEQDKSTKRQNAPTTFVLITSAIPEPLVAVSVYTTVSRHIDALPTSTTDTPLSALPEHLAGKMAVLNMVDIGHYVEGVGQRVSDRAFYIALN